MNYLKVTLMLTISIFFFSCGNSQKTSTSNDSKAQEETHEHDHASALVLDDGKKWKVHDNMMLHIQNMVNDVNGFEGSKIEDYNILSSELQTNLNLLTSNCTMTGQAHDELHKWLLPYIDLVSGFNEATDKKDAMKFYKEIDESFKVLVKYFE